MANLSADAGVSLLLPHQRVWTNMTTRTAGTHSFELKNKVCLGYDMNIIQQYICPSHRDCHTLRQKDMPLMQI